MSLAIDQLSLGQIGTNCYLVRAGPDATEAVVIDPGDEPAEIERALASHGAACAAILLTHSHFDHFGALAELAESTGAPVWLPEGELDVFRRPSASSPAIRCARTRARRRSSPAARPSRWPASPSRCATSPATRRATSPTTQTERSSPATFSSPARVGRVDLPFGDWETLLASIRSLADAYPPETIVLSGHGPATTLGDELARNPFLAELRA